MSTPERAIRPQTREISCAQITIVNFYLNSRDFNGIPILSLQEENNLNEQKLREIIISLIEDEIISLNFDDRHPNPHIKALWEESKEIQIEKLNNSNLRYVCIYPTKKYLETIVNESRYQDRPFTLRLALGEPQLSFLSFNLNVLEFYRNEPRYHFHSDDIGGSILISDEYLDVIPESDHITLQTFGFSYNSDMDRAVAVFLRYLSDLSPEHQQIWNAKLLEGDYKLHPDYSRRSAGYWGTRVSIFDAFIEELYHINQMSALIGRPHLFRDDFKESKPRNFSFLIRPTLKEFNEFIHLLDKMVSDNINRKFFLDDIPLKHEQTRKNGKIVVQEKNSITILDEWLKKKFIVNNRKAIEDMIKIFRKIRNMRQRPAHVINKDLFDQIYFKRQREIIMEAYNGIRSIRLILANHPCVKDYEIPEWLQSGKIWTY